MTEIPIKLISSLEDPRLKEQVERVWQQLPEYDQTVLAAQLEDVRDGVPDDPKLALRMGFGHVAACTYPSMLKGFLPLSAQPYHLNLYGLRNIPSDEARMFLIAHEFAHVVLRHPDLELVIRKRRKFKSSPYSEGDMEALSLWHDEHANLQVRIWGFLQEMQAFFKTYNESPWPRWMTGRERSKRGRKGRS